MRVPPVLVVALLAPTAAGAAEYSLPITADNSIVDVNGERDVNMGAASSIRLKAFQHHLVVAVDTSAVGDEQVVAATLRYRQNSETLDHVTVSTIQGDWVEGTSGGFAVEEGSSCFLGAEYSVDDASMVPWSFPGSRFVDVVYGNGHSLIGQSECPVVDGFYEWELPPDLVNALAVGASYGLAVFEASGVFSRNPTVFSREGGGAPPELVVTTAPGDAAPSEIADLAADDGADDGEAWLTWTVPERAFVYDLTIEGGAFPGPTPVPRYLVPFAGEAGSTERLRLRDILEPGADYTVELTATARGGATSPSASVGFTAGDVEDYPGADHEVEPPEGPGTGISNGDLRVWALPVTDKLRPDGSLVEDVAAGYADQNPVFDGEQVALRGLRNDMLSFQLVLQDEGATISGLSVAVTVPGLTATLDRVAFVDTDDGPVAELLRGEAGTWSTSMDEVTGAAQRAQPILVDLEVPDDAEPGDREGSVNITGPGVDLAVPIVVEVGAHLVPDAPTFNNEMNDYGYPGYLATFEELQRVARRFRSHVNLVPYSHTGRTRMDMMLPSGVYMDEAAYNDIAPGATEGNWDEFEVAFGPTFDGSLYASSAWPSAPVPGFYLTFYESWPLLARDFYVQGTKDAYEAFPAVYADTFEAIVADFVELAITNGWDEAGFQVYLNNKPRPSDPPFTIVEGSTPWTLDEPASYWDFRALGWFAERFHAGAGDHGPIDVDFRIDVSRYPYHRGQLDGLVDLAVVNLGLYLNRRLIFDIAERDGTEIWNYGTANPVTDSNTAAVGWVLSCYAMGCRGVLPWSTVKYGEEFLSGVTGTDEQQRAMFVVADDGQSPLVVPSLRLAAFRRAELDAEYLELLRVEGAYTDGQIERLILHYLDLDAAFSLSTEYAEDAGTITFAGLTSEQLWQLRSHVLDLLAELATDPGDDDDAGDDDDSAGDDDDDADDDDADDDDAAGDDDDTSSCDCATAPHPIGSPLVALLLTVLLRRRRSPRLTSSGLGSREAGSARTPR